MVGRSLSPILKKELENLNKDADSRKSAMKVLKSYARELDSKAIPLFLAKVSESGEYTISLYEVLARVHGPKILPHIDNIMATIIKTLKSSLGSFALHQSCSKVVPAIARYAMDPTTSEEKKRYIIHSLAKPLSDCLLATLESLSSGAALCLKALVDSDNWRFASNEIANEVCQMVAGALEKHAETNSHMALVMSLAKHNCLLVEPYARLLIQSGLHVLTSGNGEGNSQKRLLAIHMITALMRYLDLRSVLSELGIVIEDLVRCHQSEKMVCVRGAAFGALQLATRICPEKGAKIEKDFDFDSRGNFRRRNMSEFGNQSALTTSHESQSVDSLLEFGPSLLDSPKSANWYINGGDCIDGFAGYFPGSSRNGFVKSSNPSPQRSRSHITTPRKLIRALQDVDDNILDFHGKNNQEHSTSPSSCKLESSRRCRENGKTLEDDRDRKSYVESEQTHQSSKSVSSTEEFQCFTKAVPESKPKSRGAYIHKIHHNSKCKIICGLLVLVMAIFVSFLWNEDQNGVYNLVPT